jgi:TetR/AcrR family transcriptional regulator, lmrAB and yxaGH operons repressor
MFGGMILLVIATSVFVSTAPNKPVVPIQCASLSLISKATGLGKGSLYHFFPGGKEEMAEAVLSEIDLWFETHVFAPLQRAERAEDAIAAMFDSVNAYFRSGRRVCLVGALALGDARDRFAGEVRSYFARWVDVLAGALMRTKRNSARRGRSPRR